MNLRLAAFISFFSPVTFLSAQAVSFLAPVNTTVSGYSDCCIVSADFNGDGKTDVAYVVVQTVCPLLSVWLPETATGLFDPAHPTRLAPQPGVSR
jgi:hypothetical protein